MSDDEMEKHRMEARKKYYCFYPKAPTLDLWSLTIHDIEFSCTYTRRK